MPTAITDANIRELEPVMFRFALRAVRNQDLARDLVQDALLIAVAQAASFDGRSLLRTWVVGILSHKVLDHFRRQKVRGYDDDQEAALLAVPSAEDVERVVAARRDLALVDRALGQLPERERMALLMVDVEGVDREETCSALGLSATHLRVLLHRGRNRLRGLLEHPTGK